MDTIQSDNISPTMSKARLVGLVVVFLWFFLGGIAHFVATDAQMRIVPPYIPWPRATVLITGVLELLGALGLLWRTTRHNSALGLFILTILVTPANIYMLQQAQNFNIPQWILIMRLPLQVALLALIWWSGVMSGQTTKRQ